MSPNFFLLAMPKEPQIRFGQALEVFQGQISMKVTGTGVARNIVRRSNFFCELCLMTLKSVFGQALKVFQGQISVKVISTHVAQNLVCHSNFLL